MMALPVIHYRDLIMGVIASRDPERIDQLAAQLARAEDAMCLLQALTHCQMYADGAVKMPDANNERAE